MSRIRIGACHPWRRVPCYAAFLLIPLAGNSDRNGLWIALGIMVVNGFFLLTRPLWWRRDLPGELVGSR
jgi:hypothetical protein